MNELEAMTTFARVVETGSFSAAARSLGTTQPSVSRRIGALEAELQATLLLRSTRRLSLTESGERYYAAARRALDAVDEARQVARPERRLMQGKLRVTAPVSFSRAWLSRQLPAFIAEHPEIDLQFSFTETFLDLVEAGIDAAIRVGGPDSAELVGRRVGRIERQLVASTSWAETHGLPEEPGDLENARALAFSGSGGPWPGWPATHQGRAFELRTSRHLLGSSGDFLHALTREGLGVSVLPDWLVAEDLASGRLVRLLPEVTFESLPLWIVWPAQRFRSAAAVAFCDWFAARAQARWADGSTS